MMQCKGRQIMQFTKPDKLDYHEQADKRNLLLHNPAKYELDIFTWLKDYWQYRQS